MYSADIFLLIYSMGKQTIFGINPMLTHFVDRAQSKVQRLLLRRIVSILDQTKNQFKIAVMLIATSQHHEKLQFT